MIQDALPGVSISFLAQIGVRSEPDAKLVLDNIKELKWNMEQIIRYFVRATLLVLVFAVLILFFSQLFQREGIDT